MTYKQLLGCAIISSFLLGMGFCGSVRGESRPVSREGQALQIELDAYVDKYTDALGITDAQMQWAVVVLPVLELAGPAAIYGWLVPPESRYVPGGPEIWIALFTFHEDLMLQLAPRQRRVVAAHEVAHMLTKCRFDDPDLTGLDSLAATMRLFNHVVVKESCADIVASELTSVTDSLDTLHFLKNNWSPDNPVLIKRLQVMRRMLELEEENVE